MESYLDAVLELSEAENGVRLKDIAGRIGVTKSTANAAMAVLAENGLVHHERYGQIRLTDSGREMALGIAEKHQIIKRFWGEILKIDPDTADSEACVVEHVIGNSTTDAMQKFLTDFRGSLKQTHSQ
jgi:Mn-dependent DtxR family transcriptional regulator